MTESRSDGGTSVGRPTGPGSGTGGEIGTEIGGGPETGTEIGDGPETATPSGYRDRLAQTGEQLGALAGAELRLAWRRRWVIILVGLFTAFGLLVLTFAGSAPGPAGFERILASLATLCVYVVPLAALAYGYDTVVGPATRGWLDVLTALPVTRVRLLVGAVLGRGVVVAGGVLLGFALPGAMLILEYGLGVWPAVAAVLLAAAGLGVAFLAVAASVSTVVREKTQALGAALLAWVWFVIVHDLLALGVVAAFDLPDVAVTAAVLANPAAVYRVLVLSLLGAGGAGGFAGGIATPGLTPAVLSAALIAWVVVPLIAAATLVRWRGTLTAS